MGSVRVRKETGKLFMDFRVEECRFREQTALPDNATNRKKVEKLLARIEAKIMLGQFDYAEYFPGSKNIPKFLKLQNKPVLTVVKTSAVDCPTFSEFSEQWMNERKVEWRASHTRNVKAIVGNGLNAFFGTAAVNAITKEDLLAYRTQLSKKPGRGKNKTLGPKTINAHMTLLKTIMEEASDRFDFENPYKNIKPLRLQRSHVEPFSLIEVNKIIETVRADYRNYYTVRFYSGMRTGEIDGLQWRFVDFERRTISIRETLVAGNVEYTKTDGSQREIPMLGPVFDALRNQYAATGNGRYVFCNSSGQPLDHNNVTKRVWYPLLRLLGLDQRRPYQTRHTAATLLLASGENPEFVARFLGHSSTEMLFKVYSRYIPNLTRNDGSAFEVLLNQHSATTMENSHV